MFGIAKRISRKNGVSYHSTTAIALNCAVCRYPYSEGLCLLGADYLSILANVLAEYQFIQPAVFEFKRRHKESHLLSFLGLNPKNLASYRKRKPGSRIPGLLTRKGVYLKKAVTLLSRLNSLQI